MFSTFATVFKATTFGESHCAGVGVVVDGCPPRLALVEADIQAQLDRRRPGQSLLTTDRKEADTVTILSGTENGPTLGTPIALLVPNRVTDVCRKPQRDAHSWVFYLWQEKNEFEPKWKSAYIRKVVMPDGKVCAIGAGHHNLKIEKVMVQENVQGAVDLLKAEGKQGAFKEFLSPASRYSFLNTFIWVTDERGRALVDPAFPEQEGRHLTLFRDAIGRPVMKEIIDKLRKDDEAWVQYLWPRPGAVATSRKLAYVKKVRVGEETFLVGSDFFLATPIWMKQ